MYEEHFGEKINGSDIHKLSAEDVPNVILATASFPCTDLSVAGKRAGIKSGESSAFWGLHRILTTMGDRRPPIILLENVIGLLTSKKGRDFHDIILSINNLGYVADPFVIDARWFVPQSRPRLFVVGVQHGLLKNDHYNPSNITQHSRLRPARLIEFINAHPRLRWGLRNLIDPEIKATTLIDIIRDPPAQSEEWWSKERVDYLYNQMSKRHQDWVNDRRNSQHWHYATAFRRVRLQPDGKKRSMAELRTDGIAGCLRTPKGGSGRQILVRAGQGRLDVRLISPTECAALMGASDFKMNASLNQALFGLGDAVCVDAIRWIAENYLQYIIQPVS